MKISFSGISSWFVVYGTILFSAIIIIQDFDVLGNLYTAVPPHCVG